MTKLSDIFGVSYRLAVLGAAGVAAVVGLPPDSWVEWIQGQPFSGIVLGAVLGLVFPPVPEVVAPAFIALAPFGAGTQIAFAVPALAGNIGLGLRLGEFLPARTAARFCAVTLFFGVAAGAWGAVLA